MLTTILTILFMIFIVLGVKYFLDIVCDLISERNKPKYVFTSHPKRKVNQMTTDLLRDELWLTYRHLSFAPNQYNEGSFKIHVRLSIKQTK